MKSNATNSNSNVQLYSYLLEHFNGNMDDLKQYDADEIMHLCKLGFLKRGKSYSDGNQKDRYSLTAVGKDQIHFMFLQEKMESSMDCLIDLLQ